MNFTLVDLLIKQRRLPPGAAGTAEPTLLQF